MTKRDLKARAEANAQLLTSYNERLFKLWSEEAKANFKRIFKRGYGN